MAYQKKTLRKLPAHTRELARLVNDLDHLRLRLKNQVAKLEILEVQAMLLQGEANRCPSTMYHTHRVLF